MRTLFELKPADLPIDLRVKVQKVQKQERLSWCDTLLFLTLKVVSPSAESALHRPVDVFFHRKGGFTSRAGSRPSRGRPRATQRH